MTRGTGQQKDLAAENRIQPPHRPTPGPIAVLRDGSVDRRRLRARAPGKVTVTVALGDTKTDVEIEVVP